jgi:hypothetical protein
MKVVKNIKLTESKEKVPTSVVTDLVSRAWEEIGLIKANIDQLGKAYSGCSKLSKVFNELLDSYLIYVGKLEAFLEDSNLISYPDEKEVIEEKLDLNEDKYSSTVIERKPINIPINESKASQSIDKLLDESSDDLDNEVEEELDTNPDIEPADFFVDFDEPDLSEPKLTDDDIYGKQ